MTQNDDQSMVNVWSKIGLCLANSLDGQTCCLQRRTQLQTKLRSEIQLYHFYCIKFETACAIKEWYFQYIYLFSKLREGGGRFMRYNVMDTCLAKNGLCLSKNRIDWTTWRVPGGKLFWTLISGVHSFLSFTELFIQLIDKHCNWITLINSIAKWPKTTKSIY